MSLIIDQYAGLNHYLKDAYLPGMEWIPEKERRRIKAYLILSAYEKGTAWLIPPVKDTAKELREYGDAALLVEQALSSLLGDSQEIQSEDENTQQALRDWANRENFTLKMLEAERKAVTLGDAVYLLTPGERPALSVIDPGFYFPVLGDNDTEYPTRVHLAWTLEGDDGKPYLRRVTYELAGCEPYRVPWEQQPATVQCYLTDATWRAAMDGRLDLAPESATYKVNSEGQQLKQYPLGIDFIPIVHVPNTVTGIEHYGESLLTGLVQLLDDLHFADTDAAAAAATTGTPMLALSDPADNAAIGARSNLTVAPGAVFRLNQGGRMEAINTAPQLAEMRARVKDLTSRLSTNARIPEIALSGSTSERALSGAALQIQYSPLNALVRSLRLARQPKYALLLKMVQRLLMQTGQLNEVHPATLVFGEFMPRNQNETLHAVAEAVQAGIITRETGLRMLENTGIPVATDEAETLQRRDYLGAAQLVDATGDTQAARMMLGLPPASFAVQRRETKKEEER